MNQSTDQSIKKSIINYQSHLPSQSLVKEGVFQNGPESVKGFPSISSSALVFVRHEMGDN